MKGWTAIFRHEWRCAWATPFAGTFIIIYLVMAALFSFFVGDFFARGRADLYSFFQFQPWLLMLLAPALAMRSWSDAFQNGTAESLLTLPVSTMDIIIGKFTSQWLIAAIAIFGTCPLWITASWLGAPEHGVIVTSYGASLLIAAVLLALANAISAFCHNSVSSFGISLVAGALLLAIGAPLMQQFVGGILPKSIALAAQDFGLLASSRMMFQGVIRLSDTLNMLLMVAAFLLITRICVDRRRHVASRRFNIIAILGVLLLFTLLSSLLLRAVRLDLTDGQRFTLSQTSRALVQGLREPVRLHLMISGTGTSHYPQLQHYAQQVQDLLGSYAQAAHGKIIVQTSIIEANSDSEDRAQAAGLQAIESPSGEPVYFGLVASSSTNSVARLPFLAEAADSRLEYDVSRIIARVAQVGTPKIAIISALPLATGRGGAFAALRGQSQPMKIFELLRANYAVELQTAEAVQLDDVGLLMLIQPPTLSSGAMDKIDSFVRKGGRIVVISDPWPERWQDISGSLTSAQNLAPLLRKWGLALAPDTVVVDKDHAQIVRTTTMSGAAQLLPYPMWLKFNTITLLSSGAWQFMPGSSITRTPRLRGSAKAARISLADAMTNPSPEALAAVPPSIASPTLAMRVESAQLHGSFIADADMLDDALWDAQNGNADFLLSEVEHLLGQANLSALRNRTSAVRPFTRLAALQAAAQASYADKSAALIADLAATRARLAQLEDSDTASASRAADIAAFRQRALNSRSALRAVDRALTRRSQLIEQGLIAANLIGLPTAFGLLTIGLQMRRRRRMSIAK